MNFHTTSERSLNALGLALLAMMLILFGAGFAVVHEYHALKKNDQIITGHLAFMHKIMQQNEVCNNEIDKPGAEIYPDWAHNIHRLSEDLHSKIAELSAAQGTDYLRGDLETILNAYNVLHQRLDLVDSLSLADSRAAVVLIYSTSTHKDADALTKTLNHATETIDREMEANFDGFGMVLFRVLSAAGLMLIISAIFGFVVIRRMTQSLAARQLAEETLRKNEEKYRLLVDKMPNSIIIHQLGKILYSNPAAAAMLGVENTEVLSHRSVYDFLADSDRERLIENAKARWRNDPTQPDRYRARLKRANGEEFPAELLPRLITYHDEPAVQIVAVDMSEWEEAEQALKESEERFRNLADNAPVLIWMGGARRHGFYFNRSFVNFTGCGIAQLYGDGWKKCVHTDDLPDLLNAYESAFRSQRAFCIEYRLRHNDGSYRWVLDTGTPRFTKEGNFTGFIGSCIDISERRAFEDTLREKEERFRTLYNHTPIMLHSIDREGRLVNVSDYWTEKMDYTREEVIGRKSSDFLTPESRRYAQENILPQFFKTGVIKEVPYQFMKKNGEIFDVLLSATSERDEKGEIVRSLAVMVDVTKRKRMETALRESEEKFRNLYNRTPIMLHSLDQEGRLASVSDFWLEKMGYTREEVIGRKSIDFLTPESKRYVLEVSMPELMQSGVTKEAPLQFVKKNGEVFDTLLSAITEKNEAGEVIRRSAVIVDVTERKCMETALRESEERYRIVSEKTGQMVYDWNIITGQINWAGAIEQITGFSAEDYQQVDINRWEEMIHPADRAAAMAALDVAQLSNGMYEVEYRMRNQDGSYTLVEDRGVFLRDEHEKPYRMLGTMQDVTERKYIESALRESEERYRIVSEKTGQMVYDWDIKTGTINWAGAIEQITGFTSAEFQKVNNVLWDELIHPEDLSAALSGLIEAKAGNGLYECEYRLRKQDGTYVVVDDRGVFLRDEQNQAYRMLGTLQDLTEHKRREIELKHSQELIRNYFDLPLVGMVVVGPHDEWLEFNDTFCEMLGYTRDEMAKLRWIDLTHPDDLDRNLSEKKRATDERHQIVSIEKRYLRKDGSVLHTMVSGAVIWNDDGNMEYMAAVVQDISKSKQAMQELEIANAELQAIFFAIPDLLFRLDSDGRITGYWSGPGSKLYVPPETFLNKTFAEVLPPDVSDILNRGFEQVKFTGLATDVEYKLKMDKQDEYFEAQIAKLPSGEFAAIVRDISSRKRSEHVRTVLAKISEASGVTDKLEDFLSALQEHLSELVDTSNFYIALYDEEHDVYSFPFFVDECDSIAPTPLKLPESLTDYTRRTGEPLFCDDEKNKELKAAGEIKQVGSDSLIWIGIPLKTAHGTIGVMAMQSYTDANLYSRQDLELLSLISGQVAMAIERKRALDALIASEAQLRQAQKMEAVGRLAGGVAHDFNNLLTSILGNSELALIDIKEPRQRDLIEEVIKASHRAASLTRQLLTFSRKQVLQPTVLDVNEIVANMEKMLRRLIGEDVELSTNFCEDLGTVKADPGQLEQVLLNLVVNARDAMPNGGRILIESHNVDLDELSIKGNTDVKPGPFVMLSITDNGTGISEDVLAHIFEPFYTTKEQGKGTGLGLSTVYGIIKQSGGMIAVYSEVGHGTTFKVFLPRVDEKVAKAEVTLRSRKIGGDETILLVEDDEAVRRLLKEVLQREGYFVLEANHASVAMQISQEHKEKIDLLLTDMIMPQIGGDALARYLLGTRENLKVLFISGYTETSIFQRGFDETKINFLSKPFTADKLLDKVREILDSKFAAR